jgi:hypothetical protein
MKRTTLALTGFALATCGLTACEVSKTEKNARSVESILESDGSGNWTRLKSETRVKNYAVFKGPDGKIYAFNINVVTDGMTKDQFLAAAVSYSDLGRTTAKRYSINGLPTGGNSCPVSSTVDVTCHSFEEDERGRPIYDYDYDASTDTTRVVETVFRDSVSGLVFEVGDTSSKDLEAVSAAIEKASNESMRDMLVDGYGLSESRASEIASLARSWQNIEKTRAMTAKDMAQFESKVFGSDLNTVKKAYQQAAKGDKAAYETLIQKAAKLNNVSPEQAKAIFGNFIN